MDNFAICATVRKRPDWTTVVPALLRSKDTQWKGIASPKSRFDSTFGRSLIHAETKLETHDIAAPLVPNESKHGQGNFEDVLRVILVSSLDVESEEEFGRVTRLYHLNGGRYVAILLLMKQHDGHSPVAAMMKLQLRYSTKDCHDSDERHMPADSNDQAS